MREYISYLEGLLNNNDKILEKDIIILKDKIAFFSHERLIHLLVTIIYVIFTLLFMVMSMVSYVFLIPFFIGIIFLLFYIPHYFFLENKVQYLYKLYDKMMKKNF